MGALNNALAQASARAASAREILQLLAARQAAVERAIEIDPASAAALKPADATIAALPPFAALQYLETAGEWTGAVEIKVLDDFQHGQSRNQWQIRAGTDVIRMYFPQNHPGRLVQPGAQVRVRGVRSGRSLAVSTLLTVAQASTVAQCSTTGDQKMAVIMVTTPSNPAFPAGWNTSSTNQIFFSGSGASLNTFWEDTSYGQTSATGQVFGPYALSSDYSCDLSDNLMAAALQAAGGVDFSQYSRIAVVFPVQSCTYGGLGSIGCGSVASITQPVSEAWFPIFPSQSPGLSVGILAHEAGHNLGLNHANTEDFGSAALGNPDTTGVNTEYGDPFSVMGSPNGQYSSWQGQPIMGQYSAEHKSLILNWMRSSDYQQVVSSGSFTLAPLETASGTRGLRVLRNAAGNSWLWLEYRQPLGVVDSTLSLISNLRTTDIFQGASIHYENPLLDSLHSYLIDMNAAATPNDFYNSSLHAGQSWSDPYSLLTLKVSPAGGGALPITVTYDQPCAGLQVSQPVFQPGTGTGSVAVTAPATCVWTASTGASWIGLTGSTSGQGNGTVPFTVAANSSGTARTGFISIQRQSVAIAQAGTEISVISLTPAFGTGVAQAFTFTFNDTYGSTDINSVNFWFAGSAGACVLSYQPPNGSMWLMDDTGNWQGPVYTGTISSTRCSFSAAGTSVAGSGTQLKMTVQLGFTQAFTGNHRIYVEAFSTAARHSSGAISVGTWTVPVLPAGLQFQTLTPCRLLDTRSGSGPLAGPFLSGGASRTFPIPSGSCGVPANALSYSLNVTVVPRQGSLGYLSIWPTGQPQPLVSTLNSYDGSILANAAIVPAGTGGAVDVFATNDTDVVIDVNGYFSPPAAGSLQFYPLTPCRVLDTRNASGPFGAPPIAGGTSRSFAVTSSACGVPQTAQAYSINTTVVPQGSLGYLSVWPSGQAQPTVSTLNSLDGTVLANAAIVPAGAGGALTFFASNTTDLVVDINGYFAPPAAGGLNFYTATPCRLVDTRGAVGQFGGPSLAAGTSRSFPLTAAGCSLPAVTQAYSLNVTAVPVSGPLGYLTAWPAGAQQPLVSTLNAYKGIAVANAALIPAGTGGAVSLFASNDTNLVIDLNGYFAP